MEHGTPSEILPVEMMIDFPLFPSLFIFTSLSLKFFIIFASMTFSTFLSPGGAGTFSTALNFMEEHSDYAMCYYYYEITTVSGQTQ